MYGRELFKGVEVIRVFESGGKKRVRYRRGSFIADATVRLNQLNEEYFLCKGMRIFINDLYVKPALREKGA